MARAFKSGRKGITGHLESQERELLRNLFDDLVTMLEPGSPAHADPLAALIGVDMDVQEPTDPALKRLLPNVVNDDDAAALEFRQFTERSLREAKIGALRAAALTLEAEKIVLTGDQPKHWAMALNDVRLVLAERLGIRTEEDSERIHSLHDWSQAGDVDSYLALVYNFVSWLQEGLVQAMLAQLPDHGSPS